MKKFVPCVILMLISTTYAFTLSPTDTIGFSKTQEILNFGSIAVVIILILLTAILISKLFSTVMNKFKKTKKLVPIGLVQPCMIRNHKLDYEIMINETGKPDDSLKRIFATKEMNHDSVNLMFSDQIVPIYLIAGKGFPFTEYQYFLQNFSDEEKICRKGRYTNFFDAVEFRLASKSFAKNNKEPLSTNAWLDLENDVLWTIDEDINKTLIVILENIKLKMSQSV